MWADEIGRSRLFSENDSRADMAGGDGQKGLLVPLEIVLLLLVLVNVLVPMLVLLPVHIRLIVRCSRKSSLFCQQKSDAR